MSQQKKRLDLILQETMPMYSRQQIQSWIMQGRVKVNTVVITKAGTLVAPDADIHVDIQEPPYVSRAGLKLAAALETFNINVHGLVALDAGLSTGGFTDCLLQHGVAHVYGIDVGYGQVHEKIRHDPRVTVMERTNLREVRSVGQLVDIVTLDLSFISVTKVMDAVCAVLKPQGKLLVLIKPQFEAGKHAVGRGGIVTNPQVHEQVIATVTHDICNRGFTCVGVIPSPILGTQGNKEFIAYFERNHTS